MQNHQLSALFSIGRSRRPGSALTTDRPRRAPTTLLGVPVDSVTIAEALTKMESLLSGDSPCYAVNADPDLLAQASRDEELHRILVEADLVVADGMPLVWLSRGLRTPLPEPVPGSDLFPLLLKLAHRRNRRVVIVGDQQNIDDKLLASMGKDYRGIPLLAGVKLPIAPLVDEAHSKTIRRIRSLKPDMVIVSLERPKQEKWIAMNYRAIQASLTVGLGGHLEWIADAARQAAQRTSGSEQRRQRQWPNTPRHRINRRLFDSLPLLPRGIHQIAKMRSHLHCNSNASRSFDKSLRLGSYSFVTAPERFDASNCETLLRTFDQAPPEGRIVIDLSRVRFLDSAAAGALLRVRSQSRRSGGVLVLLNPSPAALRALRLLRLESLFQIANNAAQAGTYFTADSSSVALPVDETGIRWSGEVTAANVDALWRKTRPRLHAALADRQAINLNLANVTFIDSSGLGLLLKIRKRANQSGAALRIIQPSRSVRELAERTGVDLALFSQEEELA